MTDPTWQAIELAVDPRHPRPRHAPPLSTVVAEIVHTALWSHDCGPISYLSLPGVFRHRTLVWAGSAPSDPLSLSGVEGTDITDETATLAQLAVNASEATIGVSIVEIDPRPLGETSAFTERLLATAPTALKTTTREPSLSPLLTAASDYPQALSVVAERGTDTTELAVRRVDFTPSVQITDRDTLAETLPSPMSTQLDSPATLTNWELLSNHGWEEIPVESLPANPTVLRQSYTTASDSTAPNRALAVAGSMAEYAQVWTRAPSDPLAADYQALGATGRLTATGSTLPTFFPVETRLYEMSGWEQLKYRRPLQITPVAPLVVPPGMRVAETDPTVQASRRPAVLDDITDPFAQTVVRWCLERGETITAVESSSPAVSFHRTTVDGNTTLVYLPVGESVHPGRLLAAVWEAHYDPTIAGVTVFAQSHETAHQATTLLARPFKPPTGSVTTLYQQPRSLADAVGTAVCDADCGRETWELTPTNELRCLVDGDWLIRGQLTDSFEALASQCRRVTATATGAKITYPDGTTTAIDRETVQATLRPLSAPARPAHLATGRETATVFVQDGAEFQDVRWPAADKAVGSPDRDAFMTAFRDTYTLSDPDATLSYHVGEPELVSYGRHSADQPSRPLGWVAFAKRYRNQRGHKPTASGPLTGLRLRYMPPARAAVFASISTR
ncbi:hypothetical protein [Halorubrum sp. Atlit-28R]|uniref:hypothetical protein n=1 Tax=Halorubrum sp. Atlit-28R TaxID=2282129 RepID=UPI0011C38BBC|nr:hypothetical protein [Halorubrum sp. Atlit-28R]